MRAPRGSVIVLVVNGMSVHSLSFLSHFNNPRGFLQSSFTVNTRLQKGLIVDRQRQRGAGQARY